MDSEHTLKKPREYDQTIRNQWKAEQIELKKRHILDNDFQFSLDPQDENGIRYVAGVDISFVPGSDVDACAGVVVLSYPDLDVVWERYEMVKLTLPYIPTFLAFREVDHIVSIIEDLKEERPDLVPDVIFVDGNGYLHPREFGFACHLGVLVDIPTIGIGKTLLYVDGLGKREVVADFRASTQEKGDYYTLIGNSGKTWGVALKATDMVVNPIYVSIGHRIDLPTAIELTISVCKHKIPEPVRRADLNSRSFIKHNVPKTG
eukprot:TRINITY_DN1804_c0_g1_i5.p1 TRINITY_DN1804_c0_g1~~TRINITY_DN1804_c0_g1_i5.p1  ORF type:complete len:261 (+),score=72.28 TRINITY_DN1804_c0_g1_i5:85-867(+)